MTHARLDVDVSAGGRHAPAGSAPHRATTLGFPRGERRRLDASGARVRRAVNVVWPALPITAVVLEKTHAKTVGTGGANEEDDTDQDDEMEDAGAMEHPGSRAHAASLDAEATRARPTV